MPFFTLNCYSDKKKSTQIGIGNGCWGEIMNNEHLGEKDEKRERKKEEN